MMDTYSLQGFQPCYGSYSELPIEGLRVSSLDMVTIYII